MIDQEDILKQISDKIDDPLWLAGIEQQIISHVQDRITAKFANASTMPDIISAIKYNVASLFQEGYIPDLKNYVDPATVKNTINLALESMIDRTIDNLTMDPIWLTKVETMLKQQMALKVLEQFAGLDFEKTVREQLDENLQKWQDVLREDFSSRGIQDLATDTGLTITDDGVVVSDGLAAQELLIEKDAQVDGTLKVNRLAITGTINTDAPGWIPLVDNLSQKTFERLNDQWRKDLVEQVLDLARTQGIDFKQVSIDGMSLVENGRLNPSIRVSNIEKLGTLVDLNVRGPINLNDSVSITDRRLGINTDNPEMALSVWDEEVSVVVGKLSQQRAYIGTSRTQSLAIGINRTPHIEISAEGLTTVRELCIGRHRLSHSDQVPGWSGTRGDMVFNSNPKVGDPFAWQCLGGYQWQPLRAQ